MTYAISGDVSYSQTRPWEDCVELRPSKYPKPKLKQQKPWWFVCFTPGVVGGGGTAEAAYANWKYLYDNWWWIKERQAIKREREAV